MPDRAVCLRSAEAALCWLRRSVEASNGQGSSHSYSIVWGWAAPYPETTGYLIPTLLAWAEVWREKALTDLARQFGQWLVGLQLPDGSWAGGVLGGRHPSVFNTAMIVDGLSALAERMLDQEAAKAAAQRGLAWLMAMLDADGAWRQGLYVPGFVPAYHAYAVAAALRTAIRLGAKQAHGPLLRALHFYAGYFRPDGTLINAGLKPDRWAFTHTLAYALHGLWETAHHFGEKTIQERVEDACQRLCAAVAHRRTIAGRYGEGWRSDYSFTSPVGNAQLSCLFRSIGRATLCSDFDEWADWALMAALKYQARGRNLNTYGALPGSVPLWGPYMRGRYPNWGVKFLLDALYLAIFPMSQ